MNSWRNVKQHLIVLTEIKIIGNSNNFFCLNFAHGEIYNETKKILCRNFFG